MRSFAKGGAHEEMHRRRAGARRVLRGACRGRAQARRRPAGQLGERRPELGQQAGIFKKHGLVLEILYTQGGGETQQAVISEVSTSA